LEIASPSSDGTAIAAAVIGQTSANLDDGSSMARHMDEKNPTVTRAAFAKILSGKKSPHNHPLLRPNTTKQHSPKLFQHGKIIMQIWFHPTMN
jgi:hypothetical protein